jgi:hypothetical protein
VAAAEGDTTVTAMRQDRLVENQKLFRRANAYLEGALEDSVSKEERIPFLCECADDDCLGRVELTLVQYGAVRSHEDRFFMLPGHQLVEGEEAIEEHEEFHVTQK